MKHEFTPPPPEKSPKEILESLTSRELEVLGLIGHGLCNKDIARHLDVSIKTVEFHTGHLYQKLGVASRAQAAVWAERYGGMKLHADSEKKPGDFPSG